MYMYIRTGSKSMASLHDRPINRFHGEQRDYKMLIYLFFSRMLVRFQTDFMISGFT